MRILYATTSAICKKMRNGKMKAQVELVVLDTDQKTVALKG